MNEMPSIDASAIRKGAFYPVNNPVSGRFTWVKHTFSETKGRALLTIREVEKRLKEENVSFEELQEHKEYLEELKKRVLAHAKRGLIGRIFSRRIERNVARLFDPVINKVKEKSKKSQPLSQQQVVMEEKSDLGKEVAPNSIASVSVSAANDVGVSKLSVIQAALPKENGYPTVGFLEAIDALGKKSLMPTLLLIDEVEEDNFSNDRQVTEKQLEVINKVKEMGGQILVCCRPCQPNLKPALQAALAGSNFVYYSISELNKLQNKDLHAKLQKSDFVIVAGFDTNDCVRATIGALRDDGRLEMSDRLYPNGLIQAKIPVLYSDDCSRGMKSNMWEGSRFGDTLFLWGKPTSVYRLVDQAVKEYRELKEDIPPDFECTVNPEKLEQIKECAFAINGLTTATIKGWFRSFKIAPDNPLLDQITRGKYPQTTL